MVCFILHTREMKRREFSRLIGAAVARSGDGVRWGEGKLITGACGLFLFLFCLQSEEKQFNLVGVTVKSMPTPEPNKIGPSFVRFGCPEPESVNNGKSTEAMVHRKH